MFYIHYKTEIAHVAVTVLCVHRARLWLFQEAKTLTLG